MQILKIMVPYSDVGDIGICDAIEYQGGIWLVPYWLDHPTLKVRKPIRIVRVDLLGLQQMNGFKDCHYGVPPMSLSKAVLDGRAQSEKPIEVVESPDISIPIRAPFH